MSRPKLTLAKEMGGMTGAARNLEVKFMPVLDIDHVQIAAPKGCEAEARRFFGELLGLEEVSKPERLRARGGCWFQAGSRQLHVGVEEDFKPAKKAHVAFTASDIDGLFARLSGAGVSCTWDDEVDGVRRFYANDPWGNRLEFAGAHRR